MRNVLTIAAMEVRIYFTTWTAYLLIGAFHLLGAFYFTELVREFQERRHAYAENRLLAALEQMNLTDLVVGPLFSYFGMILILLVPVLTMRLLAAERQNHTLELLMTTPVRPIEIVLGKYLAACLVVVLMLILTLLFPAALELHKAEASGPAVDWATILVGYLGLVLFGLAVTALGLFASALTDSQIVAAVIGFALLLSLAVLGLAARGQDGAAWALVDHLALTTHLASFARGLIRLPDVVYYLSLAFVGVLLAYRLVEAQRWH